MADCPRCGKLLIPNNRVSCNGVSYCKDCVAIVALEEKKREQKRQELYGYIKKLYDIDTIPEIIIETINALVEKKDKTYNGIQQTLRYYYEIFEHQPKDISKLRWVVLENYEDAKNYLIKQREVLQHNKEFVDKSQTITYKINPDELFKPKKKDSINIEDL